MWITVITSDIVAIRSLDPAVLGPAIDLIRQKKGELQDLDGNGKSMSGFVAPDRFDEIAPDSSILTVKRAWNNESYAQQFADFVNDSNIPITAVVEAQP